MVQYKTRDINTHYTIHNVKRRIKHTNSFALLEVGQGVVEEGLISFGS